MGLLLTGAGSFRKIVNLTLPTYTGNRIISSAVSTNADFSSIVANNGYLGERNDAVQNNRWLLKYAALSDGTIPSYASILSASLWLYLNTDFAAGADNCDVFPSLRAWSPSTSNWNNWSTGNAWTTAGSGSAGNDYINTVVGTYAFSGAESPGWREFVLTPAYVQNFVNGTWTNNGFFLKFQSEFNSGYRFDCGISTESNLPYIQLSYR